MIKDIISGNTFVPLMNVLMFIPLGILAKEIKSITLLFHRYFIYRDFTIYIQFRYL